MNVISKIVETFRRRASERDEKRRIEMWLNNATKKELQIEYEAERQRWSKSGGGEKTMWMKTIKKYLNHKMIKMKIISKKKR